MTKRERVIAALTHKETDFIPYQIDFTNQAWETMAKYYNDNDFASKIGNHIDTCTYWGDPEPIPDRDGYFRDDFGVVWNRNGADKDIGVVEKILIPEPDLCNYKFPEVPEQRIRERCESVLANAGDKFTFASISFSLFERAWTLTGMENLLAYMITDPDFVHTFFDKLVEYNMKIIKIYLEYDFDGIFLGDDWGQQKGLIMGPVFWRKFIKPQLAKMYSLGKDNGRFIGQHSCGDIQEIYPDLVEIGLDVHQTFQPEIFDVEEIKSLYRGKLSFWGGISTQKLLPFATPSELVQKSKEIMKIVSKGGGFIVAPTHSIPGDVPAENMHTLIELLKNQNESGVE